MTLRNDNRKTVHIFSDCRQLSPSKRAYVNVLEEMNHVVVTNDSRLGCYCETSIPNVSILFFGSVGECALLVLTFEYIS